MDIAYIIIPVLLILVVLASVWLDRFSVPVILVALGAGRVRGDTVTGGHLPHHSPVGNPPRNPLTTALKRFRHATLA